MGKLTDLSNELLLNITSHLSTEDEDDTRALLHLCRTSRLLFNVAQPALYRCVRLDRLAADPLVQSKLFLRTLMEFPSLAQKTKELAVFTELGVDFEWPALEHDSVFMDLVAVVGGHPADLEPEICYGPLAVPIVARLTNLEHLHLTARIKVPPSLMQRIHELQADRSILPKLKTFHLYKMYEDDPVNIDEYVPLLRYPSFEKFTSDCDIRYNQDGYPATNTITHTAVELFWCLRPLPGMERLFNACSHLTVFKFLVPDWRCFRWAGDVMSDPLVTPRDLVKALLRTHRQNLQTLHLDFHYYYNLHDPELLEELEDPLERCEYIYPSFRDFERLSHITIEFEKLVKFGDLPASLEHLELHYCHFAELDKAYLNDLIELKSKWCPVIQSVILNAYDYINNPLTEIQELVISLNMAVHVTVHGRLLEISGMGYHLTIQNLAQ